MLRDVNLFFKLQKLHYSISYIVVDTQCFMHTMFHAAYNTHFWYVACLLLGYALLEVSVRLDSTRVSIFLENPTIVSILTNFAISMMEQMVLSAILSACRIVIRVMPVIRAELAPSAISPKMGPL